MTHEGPALGWVQTFTRQQNGHGAYLALRSHYLGDAFQGRLHAKADQTLESTYYDRTKCNFSFEKYTETLQHAFTDLASTGELVSKEHKVRVLMNGISDQWLEAAKNQVLATARLKAMYEAASNFMAEALDNKASYAGSVAHKARISSTTTTNREFTGGQHSGRGQGTMCGCG